MFDAAAITADKAVIVTEPEVASLRDADAADRYLREKKVQDISIVVNKVKVDLMKAGFVPDISQIIEMFKTPVAGLIQYDENIHISTNLGIPIVCKEGTYIDDNFRQIVSRVIQ